MSKCVTARCLCVLELRVNKKERVCSPAGVWILVCLLNSRDRNASFHKEPHWSEPQRGSCCFLSDSAIKTSGRKRSANSHWGCGIFFIRGPCREKSPRCTLHSPRCPPPPRKRVQNQRWAHKAPRASCKSRTQNDSTNLWLQTSLSQRMSPAVLNFGLRFFDPPGRGGLSTD